MRKESGFQHNIVLKEFVEPSISSADVEFQNDDVTKTWRKTADNENPLNVWAARTEPRRNSLKKRIVDKSADEKRRSPRTRTSSEVFNTIGKASSLAPGLS